MKARQFWYPLPERLIAQHPAERRGTERMMVLHRDTGVIEHRHIADIVEYLTPNDLLVVNDTKVFPARLIGTWADTPGEVEVLMVAAAPEAETVKELVWNVIIGSGRKCREGQTAVFGPNGELKAHLLAKLEGIGMWKVAFECDRPLMDLLEEFGHTPVPPETAEAINACKARGGRVVCVGSTTVRTLETVANRERGEGDPLIAPGSGASNIFIYPPYRFRVCDAMLTNFHLPQSTLLMMVSALAGRERILCAYAFAVKKEYQFFSYGDCMLII